MMKNPQQAPFEVFLTIGEVLQRRWCRFDNFQKNMIQRDSGVVRFIILCGNGSHHIQLDAGDCPLLHVCVITHLLRIQKLLLYLLIHVSVLLFQHCIRHLAQQIKSLVRADRHGPENMPKLHLRLFVCPHLCISLCQFNPLTIIPRISFGCQLEHVLQTFNLSLDVSTLLIQLEQAPPCLVLHDTQIYMVSMNSDSALCCTVHAFQHLFIGLFRLRGVSLPTSRMAGEQQKAHFLVRVFFDTFFTYF
mmetsp:Transcript_3960/g.8034  ORF Transcript_3960/g.8034 Transcript_3960/m.8034 type:complete len:247 (+) Transcript_3960:1300-2040(+)